MRSVAGEGLEAKLAVGTCPHLGHGSGPVIRSRLGIPGAFDAEASALSPRDRLPRPFNPNRARQAIGCFGLRRLADFLSGTACGAGILCSLSSCPAARRCSVTGAGADAQCQEHSGGFQSAEEHGSDHSPCQGGGRIACDEPRGNSQRGPNQRSGKNWLCLACFAGEHQGCGNRRSPADQPPAQPLACPCQPAPHGSLRKSQPDCGFLVVQAFQVAECDRCPEVIGKPGNFLLERLELIVIAPRARSSLDVLPPPCVLRHAGAPHAASRVPPRAEPRRRASSPANSGAGSSLPDGPARGTRPGRRLPHRGDRGARCGKRAAPSARAGSSALQTRPPRPRRVGQETGLGAAHRSSGRSCPG